MLTPTLRSPRQILQGCAGALALLGLVWLALSQSELVELETLAEGPSIQATGHIQIQRKSLSLRGSNGLLFECPLHYCGFKGLSRYSGAEVTIKVAGGRIIEMTTREGTLNTLSVRAEEAENTRAFALLALLGAVGLLRLAMRSTPRSQT